MKQTVFFVVSGKTGRCKHRHKRAVAAQKCLEQMKKDSVNKRLSVYAIFPGLASVRMS